jgi:hypothetical protein
MKRQGARRPAAFSCDHHHCQYRLIPTKLSPEPMATSSPMRSSQPRRYRLVDQHGQPHLELDEHFDSIEEAWSFATRWWQQQKPAGEPASQIGLGLEVSTESGGWRTLRHPQG